MKIIVLGGTGWVGHHIVEVLHAAGHEVTICSRGKKATYANEISGGVRRVTANKSNQDEMARVFEDHYEVVIDSVPTEASIDNVVGHAKDIKHYLHCSSTGGYAPLPFIPGDETMPYDHYFRGGWKQKAVVDTKVMDLFHSQGFPATVIRPCYITGPGLLPLDNLGGRREDFIPDILAGRTLDLPNDGQALLQPIHVEDLAAAFLLAVQKPESAGEIFNICLEKAVSIASYIGLNAAALQCEARINLMSLDAMLEKHGESVEELGLRFFATHMCFDIRKAREQLGYRPRHTTEEAIRETAQWAAGRPA